MKKTSKKGKETAAIWEDISVLVEWDENPRNNDKAVDKVATSIKRFGFASPILARKADKMIIAGHTRFKAAHKLGLEHVPVRYLDLDLADAKLLAIADNKVGEIATWNDDLLAITLEELKGHQIEDFFSEKELERLLDDDLDEDHFEEDTDYVYQIFVENLNADTQAELLERLIKEGYQCRALTV